MIYESQYKNALVKTVIQEWHISEYAEILGIFVY